jgi:hypothetical protein
MSENSKRLWESLKSDAKAEMSRLGTQGAMELASALFNGNAFVPYGPGQYTPSQEQQQEHAPEQPQDHGQEHAQEQDREMGLER